MSQQFNDINDVSLVEIPFEITNTEATSTCGEEGDAEVPVNTQLIEERERWV